MRVLILSCNTGEGHNSCAEAIRQACLAHGDSCSIQDSLNFISPGFSRFMSWGHTTMYRHVPGLFQVGYGYSEKHPGLFRRGSGVYHLLTRGTQRLREHILTEGYDTVLCVHVFSALLLTAMLQKYPTDVRTGFVATDYTCSPSVQESRLDRYFIPDARLETEFGFPHMSGEKLVASGIPIRQGFYAAGDRAAARQKFGIPQGHTHLLMMCGSMGCGPMKKLTALLSRSLGPEQDITIVCGTNEKLRRWLDKRYAGCPNIHILGYVRQMDELMDSADLYLTKPGGLSVTEAAAKKLPMVFINAVAGCEEYNSRYFSALGGARTAANVRELARLCQELLDDGGARREMARALETRENTNAAQRIYSEMAALARDTRLGE